MGRHSIARRSNGPRPVDGWGAVTASQPVDAVGGLLSAQRIASMTWPGSRRDSALLSARQRVLRVEAYPPRA